MVRKKRAKMRLIEVRYQGPKLKNSLVNGPDLASTEGHLAFLVPSFRAE